MFLPCAIHIKIKPTLCPFLPPRLIDPNPYPPQTANTRQLLDRLLPKLKAAGHRVVIFSQWTHLLGPLGLVRFLVCWGMGVVLGFGGLVAITHTTNN